MSGLYELVKKLRRTQDLIDSAGLSQIDKLAQSVSGIKNNSTLSQLIEMSVAAKAPFHPIIRIQDLVNKELVRYQRMVMPPSIYDSIDIIYKRHAQFYEQWKTVAGTFDWTMKVSQIHSLQMALEKITSQFAIISATKGYWESFEDFEEITADVTTISERVIENEVITKEDINEIKSLLYKLNNKDKSIDAIIWKWIGIIGFILALISEGRNWIPKPEAASKEDIEILKKEFIKQVSLLEKETGVNKITNRICKVYFKPNGRNIITILPDKLEVVVLQIHHKWVYISYINPKDNLTETGWVMKKYLSIEN